MKKIILLGYMGCGKSTIAKLLAQKIGFPFKDLDHLIESSQNSSVSEIFTKQGEIQFRKMENSFLKKLMASDESFVLSLGGGTPCYANNHELINGDGIISIYLKASIEELYGRLIRNKSKRPIIAQLPDEEIKEFIAKHLFERSFFYTKASNTILVDGKSPETIVSEIENLI